MNQSELNVREALEKAATIIETYCQNKDFICIECTMKNPIHMKSCSIGEFLELYYETK